MGPSRLSYPGAVRLPRLSPSAFRTLVLVTLVALVVITVVGAGVRLTESGLGCSTWPRCEPDSFTPRSASDGHAMVEFANRMLNAAVGLLSVATVAGALLRDPRRRDLVRWSWGVFAWVASNGIVGAFVVWLHLSPVSVIGHFALALGAIWNALVLLQRAGEDDGAGERRRVDATGRFVTATKVLLVAAGAVLATGTLVTGSGPHAGDERADRLALEVGTVARVHGLTMIAFLAVTLALIRMAHRGEAGPRVAHAPPRAAGRARGPGGRRLLAVPDRHPGPARGLPCPGRHPGLDRGAAGVAVAPRSGARGRRAVSGRIVLARG